jgi:uncharacterized protein YjiS (DUF1127 family)
MTPSVLQDPIPLNLHLAQIGSLPVRFDMLRRSARHVFVKPLVTGIAGPLTLFGRLASLIALWRRRARDRGELAQMTELELRDIGRNSGDLSFEINKPFWRA